MPRPRDASAALIGTAVGVRGTPQRVREDPHRPPAVRTYSTLPAAIQL